MAEVSSIEWLYNPYDGRQGSSWNRWWGCERFSPACNNCYIVKQPPLRMQHLVFDKAAVGGKTAIVMAPDGVLFKPLQWTTPRMIFVESLGDLWHGAVNLMYTAEMYAIMLLAPHHVFLTLTKRTKRMRNWLRDPRFAALVTEAIMHIVLDGPVRIPRDRVLAALHACRAGTALRLPAHIWTGTTVENNDTAAERLPLLLDIDTDGPRWGSAEPLTDELTDPLNLSGRLVTKPGWSREDPAVEPGIMVPGSGVDWMVFGGESGPPAKATELDTTPAVGLRPISLENLALLIGQTRMAGVPVFVKQLGQPWAVNHYDKDGYRADKAGRDINQWPAHLRVREYPLALAKHTLHVDPANEDARAALAPAVAW